MLPPAPLAARPRPYPATILAALSCVLLLGDSWAGSPRAPAGSPRWVAAAVDVTLHALVAGVAGCGALLLIPPAARPRWRWVAGVAAAGVAVDADHFLAAGSLSLDAATSLPSRPWGHAVSVWAGVVAGVAAGGHPSAARSVGLGWGTNLLRDGLRRGLWVPPLGATPPLPLWGYVGCVCALCCGVAGWAASARRRGA